MKVTISFNVTLSEFQLIDWTRRNNPLLDIGWHVLHSRQNILFFNDICLDSNVQYFDFVHISIVITIFKEIQAINIDDVKNMIFA